MKSRKEPRPEEFSDKQAYNKMWKQWRLDRDINNKSVQRCRKGYVQEKKDHRATVASMNKEHERLQEVLHKLMKQVQTFNKLFAQISEEKVRPRTVRKVKKLLNL